MHLLHALGVIALLASGPLHAAENPLAGYLWEARPVVVFADSPKDPRYQKQMEDFARREPDILERDVVLLTDTDPAANGPLRQKLRPRGFMMVLIGKDGEIKLRRPNPMSVDALTRLIDRIPLRQQEIDERRRLQD
ncbi:DUF4174 domain-containing protein [Pikeienuella piscinae]|nr:DUF4174 domain-containing protein [Pikeienuella piscinae]